MKNTISEVLFEINGVFNQTFGLIHLKITNIIRLERNKNNRRFIIFETYSNFEKKKWKRR